MNILALNAGSSTLKYKLIHVETEEVLLDGLEEHSGDDSLDAALEQVVNKATAVDIDAVGHRVVHGGHLFHGPTMIDERIIQSLRTLRDLDPLHNPQEVALIESTQRLLPKAQSVAVFDTGFHNTIPDIAALYAIPRHMSIDLHIRRYGFHGISYQYVSGVLIDKLGRGSANTKLIICHVGSGASVCAVQNGSSVDTSMGLTPLEGLVMGTRSGDIDPGLMLYLLQSQQMSAADLDQVLNHASGLQGLSGVSNDVRVLEKAAGEGNADAEQALAVFAYRLRKYIGSYAAALGGVDAVAFTGGIGEHSPDMRQRAAEGLEFLGIALDTELNRAVKSDAVLISKSGQPVQVWSIPTNEELQIVRETADILQQQRQHN